jgi:exonuclease V gamma subunit
MRSIPAEVICLVGMNDDAFPGRDRAPEVEVHGREGGLLGGEGRREERDQWRYKY